VFPFLFRLRLVGAEAAGWEGFGDVEGPDACAGADVGYFEPGDGWSGGGEGDGDVGVDEKAEGFGCDDVLFVESG
jgi:hypothetical protein